LASADAGLPSESLLSLQAMTVASKNAVLANFAECAKVADDGDRKLVNVETCAYMELASFGD
jgi:hypothetical protein